MNDQPNELDQYAYLWDGSEPGWMLVTGPQMRGDLICNLSRRKTLRIDDEALKTRVCERMKAAGCEVRHIPEPPTCQVCGQSATIHISEMHKEGRRELHFCEKHAGEYLAAAG